jgi:hypothetical protein
MTSFGSALGMPIVATIAALPDGSRALEDATMGLPVHLVTQRK